jgi:hypothetical protein
MEADAQGWSESERVVARRAFDLACQREIASLIEAVQLRFASISTVESVWELHDFLSIRRHELEGRFDFRLSGLLFVFAGFVRDGLLTMAELEGLSGEKLAKIAAMARF